jgi:hypothetical protein
LNHREGVDMAMRVCLVDDMVDNLDWDGLHS